MLPGPASTGLLLTLAAAGCYGFNIAFARLASFAGIAGASLVFYRVLVMLALVLATALVLRRSLRVAPAERGAVLVLGLSTAVLGLAYLSSVAFVPVTVAVVVFYTYPALIVLASPLVEGRALAAPLVGIAALALTGVVLVIGPVFEGLDWRGLALAALASLATAVQFFAGARARNTGLAAKVFWVHLLVLPLAAAAALAFTGLNAPADLLLAPWAVGLTVLGYVVGFGLQLAALARSSAVVAGLAFCAEPVAAALTSAMVLGEGLSGLQLAGGALVVAAVAGNALLDRAPPDLLPTAPTRDAPR